MSIITNICSFSYADFNCAGTIPLVTDIFTETLIGFVRTIDAYLTYPAERLSNHVLSMKLGDTIQVFRYRTYFNL